MNENKFASLSQADHETTAAIHFPSSELRDRVRFLVWLVYGGLAGTVLVTTFIVLAYLGLKDGIKDGATNLDRFVKEKFEPLSKEKAANEAKIAANEAKIAANEAGIKGVVTTIESQRTTETAALTAIQGQVAQILKQIEDWKPRLEEERRMWYMKESGESNQDAFFREHGYYSPSDPRSQGQHRSH